MIVEYTQKSAKGKVTATVWLANAAAATSPDSPDFSRTYGTRENAEAGVAEWINDLNRWANAVRIERIEFAEAEARREAERREAAQHGTDARIWANGSGFSWDFWLEGEKIDSGEQNTLAEAAYRVARIAEELDILDTVSRGTVIARMVDSTEGLPFLGGELRIVAGNGSEIVLGEVEEVYTEGETLYVIKPES